MGAGIVVGMVDGMVGVGILVGDWDLEQGYLQVTCWHLGFTQLLHQPVIKLFRGTGKAAGTPTGTDT